MKRERMKKKSDEGQLARDRKPIYFYFIIPSKNHEHFFQNYYFLLTKFISRNHSTRHSKSMKFRDELFLTLRLQAQNLLCLLGERSKVILSTKPSLEAGPVLGTFVCTCLWSEEPSERGSKGRQLAISSVWNACLSLQLYCKIKGIILNWRTIFDILPLSKILFLFRQLMILKMAHQRSYRTCLKCRVVFPFFFQVINTWHLGNEVLNLPST